MILPGSDLDEYGCKASAGYIWCEELQRCIRPWETECSNFKKESFNYTLLFILILIIMCLYFIIFG
jgi:hypothetical protein